MKPLGYVRKYDLQSGKKFDHSHFIGDLTLDFMSLLELGRKSDGTYTMKGFDNTVDALRQKWNGIHNKTIPGLPDKLWRYFYATVVVRVRDEMFPEIMAQRQRDQEERIRDQEERIKEQKKRREERFKQWYSDSWQDFIFGSILGDMFKDQVPTTEFKLLGLSTDDDEQMVRSTYKRLAMEHHPDRGGRQEAFIKITDAKNKCLAYLSNKIR